MAAKRTAPSSPASLFDTVPALAAPVLVASASSLSPDQERRARIVAASIGRDIARFQQQLASPLTSWDQQSHQSVEANVALSFTVKCLLEFLPADLQPLLAQFIDLRSQIVLREFEEG